MQIKLCEVIHPVVPKNALFFLQLFRISSYLIFFYTIVVLDLIKQFVPQLYYSISKNIQLA